MQNAPANIDMSKVKVIAPGIEGELIDTEILHFEKWRDVAMQAKLVEDDIAFQTLWQTKLVGVGDKAIYETLAVMHQAQKGATFAPWEDVQKTIDTYYENNLHRAKVVDGAPELIRKAQADGKQIFIPTHAPQALAEKQLAFLRKSGIDLPVENVVYERKDGTAYSTVLRLAQKNDPTITADQVLVLDASPKYIQMAQSLGMQTAHIKSDDMPDHLRQSAVTKEVEWTDLLRNDKALVLNNAERAVLKL